ncbi:MAG TPA: tetratricopeptide repeat protein [Bacteroidota bacterium]|nr:tetratricopeptide repeat protein [Bacteroidota bacterium]
MIKQQENPAIPRSRGRLFLFRITIVLFPIVFLLSLELFLRIVHYGDDYSLVISRSIKGKEYYQLNRGFARKYFAQAGIAVPELVTDVFEREKGESTIRIFCLGESTMAGFPYEYNATAPSFLKDRLSLLLPRRNVEVINVGLAAVGSTVVLDLLSEVMEFQPDLVVIYVGHNEFYGIYGAASTIQIPGGRWITKLHLRLLESRLYLFLRSVLISLRLMISPSEGLDKRNLMQQMIKQDVPLESPLYKEARANFAKNVGNMLDIAAERRIPLLFCTLVSNLRTHPPFRPLANVNNADDYKQLIAMGDSASVRQNHSIAAIQYSEAARRDTGNALAFFKLGTALYHLQDYEAARRAFVRAKDLDALRFRATEDFQQILIQTVNGKSGYIARIDSVFALHSPHGIIGSELMTEHLHPNIEGYFLMAKTLAATILEKGLIEKNGQEMQLITDEVVWNRSGVTTFDTLLGSITISFLTQQWPFTDSKLPPRFTPSDVPQAIVYEYLTRKLEWREARYLLSEHYAANGQYDRARAECRAVEKVRPFDYEPALRRGDYYLAQNNFQAAINEYENSLEAEENPFAHSKLGLIYLQQHNIPRAIAYLLKSLQPVSDHTLSLPKNIIASNHYLLAVAYAQNGQFAMARQYAQRSLTLNPDLRQAEDLLRQIERIKR